MAPPALAFVSICGAGLTLVFIPAACVGMGTYQLTGIFDAFLEETIVWLSRVGLMNTLMRLYQNTNGQPLLDHTRYTGGNSTAALYS